MKLFIPTIGQSIQLEKNWDFSLYPEPRNFPLFQYVNQGIEKDDLFNLFFAGTISPSDDSHWYYEMGGEHTFQIQIPAGAVLKIDRIYIRKGNQDFDSISFFITHMNNALEKDFDKYCSNGKKVQRNKVRFWAKLQDVNNIECFLKE